MMNVQQDNEDDPAKFHLDREKKKLHLQYIKILNGVIVSEVTAKISLLHMN